MDLEEELTTALQAIERLPQAPNVAWPKDDELRRSAEAYGTRTEFGNYVFHTMVKNRSAGATVYVGSPAVQLPNPSARQREILAQAPQTLGLVTRYLAKAPFVGVECSMGDNPEFVPFCRTVVSVARPEMVRIAYMWRCLLNPPAPSAPGPRQTLLYIPEWQEKDRQILVFPERNLTLVLGSDYLGESKKGHLRMAMWNAKQAGMLGVHAGAKLVTARDATTGKLRRYSMILFGLTATGKTTHTCHHHGLDGAEERIEIVQDDVVFLRPDGGAYGTERGFYLKTDGLAPDTQPLLWRVATQRDAVFENIMVDYRGKVDFADELLTSNGRGVVQWADFGAAKAATPNLPPLSEVDGLIVVFITRRNTVVPIASKLTIEQAAAAFMLGESIESSGGDPRRAGESVRVVGTNPFIVGDLAEEGNRFYALLKAHSEKAQCYLLNTGGVGELVERTPEGGKRIVRRVLRVEISEMAAILRGIVRRSIDWVEEPWFGTRVPRAVEGADLTKFDLRRFYSATQIDEAVSALQRERAQYLAGFHGLEAAIVAAGSRAACAPTA